MKITLTKKRGFKAIFKRVRQPRSHRTMCKFHDFSVTQILREINFGEFRSSKTDGFVILKAPNFVELVNFGLQKVQILKYQNLELLNVSKWQILRL